MYSIFEGLGNSASKACAKYDKFIIIGDFKTDVKKFECLDYDRFEEFGDTFNLTNLIKEDTRISKNHKSAIDSFFTK